MADDLPEAASAIAETSAKPSVKAPRSPQKPPLLKVQTITLVAVGCTLLEPYENCWFKENQPREVHRVTRWMQMQIEAGLLKVV